MSIFPATTLDGQPPAQGLEGVPFLPRVGAKLIDYVAHFIVSFIAGAFTGVVLMIYATIRGLDFDTLVGGRDLMVNIFGVIGFFLFTAILEAMHGSTIGKRLLGFVVISDDKTRVKTGQAFKRSLMFLIDSFFFGLVAYGAMSRSLERRRYGDDWAKTMVVERKAVDPRLLRSEGMLVLALLVAAAADAVCMMIGILLDVAINN